MALSRFYGLRGLARKLAAASPNSEYVASLWDEPGGVCDNLGLDSVTDRQIKQAKEAIYRASQEALVEDRHLPEEFTVYRGGAVHRDCPVLPVTLSRRVASEPYFAGHGGLWMATVSRKDVLVDMESIVSPAMAYTEQELLVPGKSLRNLRRVRASRPRLSR